MIRVEVLMPRGRPLPALEITKEERETLERWIARRKTAQALAQRARLVLACAEGNSNKAVSAQIWLPSYPGLLRVEGWKGH